ncbi:MAG: hypothetical protein LIR40_07710, partial [Bacteroidota bacterium]|nr:hypothetical protein [Bacteroidota bacterium]
MILRFIINSFGYLYNIEKDVTIVSYIFIFLLFSRLADSREDASATKQPEQQFSNRSFLGTQHRCLRSRCNFRGRSRRFDLDRFFSHTD